MPEMDLPPGLIDLLDLLGRQIPDFLGVRHPCDPPRVAGTGDAHDPLGYRPEDEDACLVDVHSGFRRELLGETGEDGLNRPAGRVSVDRREGGVALSDDGVFRVGLDEWVEVREDVGVELDLYEGASALAQVTSNPKCLCVVGVGADWEAFPHGIATTLTVHDRLDLRDSHDRLDIHWAEVTDSQGAPLERPVRNERLEVSPELSELALLGDVGVMDEQQVWDGLQRVERAFHRRSDLFQADGRLMELPD